MEATCALAGQSFAVYRETSLEARSAFLEAIADTVLELGDTLITRCMYNKALPNDEAKLRALIAELKTHGRLLFVVDQPSTIGALPVAVARAEGVLVAYLPGLAMRRIADLHAGEAKTDARDAAIIAEAARSMPHTLRSLRLVKLSDWCLLTLFGRS